jgi:hypothetical protein
MKVIVTSNGDPIESWPCSSVDEAKRTKAGRVSEYRSEGRSMFDPQIIVSIEGLSEDTPTVIGGNPLGNL